MARAMRLGGLVMASALAVLGATSEAMAGGEQIVTLGSYEGKQPKAVVDISEPGVWRIDPLSISGCFLYNKGNNCGQTGFPWLRLNVNVCNDPDCSGLDAKSVGSVNLPGSSSDTTCDDVVDTWRQYCCDASPSMVDCEMGVQNQNPDFYPWEGAPGRYLVFSGGLPGEGGYNGPCGPGGDDTLTTTGSMTFRVYNAGVGNTAAPSCKSDIEVTAARTQVKVNKKQGEVIVEIPADGRSSALDAVLSPTSPKVTLFGSNSAPLHVKSPSSPNSSVTIRLSLPPASGSPVPFKGLSESPFGAPQQELTLATDVDGVVPTFYLVTSDLYKLVGSVDNSDVASVRKPLYEFAQRGLQLEVAFNAKPALKVHVDIIDNLFKIVNDYQQETYYIPERSRWWRGPDNARDESVLVCKEYQGLSLIYLNLMRHDLLAAWSFVPSTAGYIQTDWMLAGLDYAPYRWPFVKNVSMYEHQFVVLHASGSDVNSDPMALILDPFFAGKATPFTVFEHKRSIAKVINRLLKIEPSTQGPVEGDVTVRGSCYGVPNPPYPDLGGTRYDNAPFSTGCRLSSDVVVRKYLGMRHPQVGPKSIFPDGSLEKNFSKQVAEDMGGFDAMGKAVIAPVVLGKIPLGTEQRLTVKPKLSLFPGGTPPSPEKQPDAVLEGDRLSVTHLTYDDGEVARFHYRIRVFSPLVMMLEYADGKLAGLRRSGDTWEDLPAREDRKDSISFFQEDDGGLGVDLDAQQLDFKLRLTAYETGSFSLVANVPNPEGVMYRIAIDNQSVIENETFTVTFDPAVPSMTLTRDANGEQKTAKGTVGDDGSGGSDGSAGTAGAAGGGGGGGASNASSSEDDGCGCRAAGSERRSGGASVALLLVGGLALALRQRRAQRAS